MLTLPM
jgi:hypothetical protein